jgi:hypothetical protein
MQIEKLCWMLVASFLQDRLIRARPCSAKGSRLWWGSLSGKLLQPVGVLTKNHLGKHLGCLGMAKCGVECGNSPFISTISETFVDGNIRTYSGVQWISNLAIFEAKKSQSKPRCEGQFTGNTRTMFKNAEVGLGPMFDKRNIHCWSPSVWWLSQLGPLHFGWLTTTLHIQHSHLAG